MNKEKEIIKILLDCAVACDHCFNGCLREKEVEMLSGCIRLDKDCAAMCRITASFIASGSDYAAELVDICSDICSGCARECEKHDYDYCRICAIACRKGEEACENFAPSTL